MSSAPASRMRAIACAPPPSTSSTARIPARHDLHRELKHAGVADRLDNTEVRRETDHNEPFDPPVPQDALQGSRPGMPAHRIPHAERGIAVAGLMTFANDLAFEDDEIG